ncbi:MAG: conjugative relaxase [Nitrospira sp.]
MMSITKVTSVSAQHYYSREDYYTTQAEARAASAWVGKAADRIGLSGPIERDQFREVLDGKLPDGIDMAANGGSERRAGFDATFSAPKSVSLLAEIGDDTRVFHAHRIATQAGLHYLQEHAAYARMTEDGNTRLKQTGNLLIATFEHHTSRAGDPQLHSHAVIINATQRADGEWRALAGEKIYEAKMTAGAVYRATLAHELQEQGYQISVTHNDGRFEVTGLNKEHLDHFSQRARDIRNVMEDRGLDGAKGAERATLLTREAKRDVNIEYLRQEWRERAEEHGIDLKRIVMQAQERATLGAPGKESLVHAKEAVEWAVAHTSERQTLVSSVELHRYAAEKATGKASFEDIREAIAEYEKNGSLIRVNERYTTLDALRVEQQTIDLMKAGQSRVLPLMAREGAEGGIQAQSLTSGQERAVLHILTSSDRFIGIEGLAGTGKTTMLRHVNSAIKESGIQVHGLAVSASAARTLENEAGIRSETVAQFLHTPASRVFDDTRKLYVIDESSLLGARMAHGLMARIQQENARAVFVGDRGQLSAIEAGKPFAVLVNQGMQTVRMDQILRQRDADLRFVVEKAAEGRTLETISHLEKLGRLTAVSDRNDRLAMVVAEYLGRPPSEQADTLVLTGSREDRSALNETIRTGLQQQGVLSAHEMEADVLVQRAFTKAQLREGGSYNVGEMVRFAKSYPGLEISKGDYGIIQAVNAEQGIVVLRMESAGRIIDWQPERYAGVEVFQREHRSLRDGDLIRWTKNDYSQDRRNGDVARVVIDFEKGAIAIRDREGNESAFDPKRDRHWDHGYASTIHSSQGRTADRTIVHADSQQLATNKEAWYVAVSRPRNDLRVITDDVKSLREAVGESRAQESAIEAVGKSGVEKTYDRQLDRDLSRIAQVSLARQAELER